ncbi:DUF6804 family protein [Curtobacterium sp. 'Ferrero']|uniref:DUF6804 family protein n=1 Tax=Curtobacterium sp. 'Ferrero' TaxID=2033654 RepID=UPI0020D0BCA6|nr:DUF6804 family protein [Curtobacterium sp. 'Ferrero']
MAARRGRPAIGSSQHGVPARPAPTPARSDTRSSGATPSFTRPGLAPSLLAAVVLLACVAFLDAPAFVFVRWAVTVLALIVLVFTVRGRAWWATVLMAAIAVCWNPVAVVPIVGEVWATMQIVAAAVFVVVGIVLKVPRGTDAG